VRAAAPLAGPGAGGTTAFYASKLRSCKRCKKSFHATGDSLGCAAGAPPKGSRCGASTPSTPTGPCAGNPLPLQVRCSDMSGGDYSMFGVGFSNAVLTFTCGCDGSSVVLGFSGDGPKGSSEAGACVVCAVPGGCTAGATLPEVPEACGCHSALKTSTCADRRRLGASESPESASDYDRLLRGGPEFQCDCSGTKMLASADAWATQCQSCTLASVAGPSSVCFPGYSFGGSSNCGAT
jgi:hypothetical protein